MITEMHEIFRAPVMKVGAKAKSVGIIYEALRSYTNITAPSSLVITVDEVTKCKTDEEFRYSVAQEIKELFGEQKVIVRSSSVFEDSKLFSGAGQYESFMNRSTIQEIADAILMVCNSVDSESAKAYNKLYLNNSDSQSESMAILCQEMVQCDYSGVLYSADPLEQTKNHFLIEMNKGLGDKIASGECMSHTYSLPVDGGSSISFSIPIFYDFPTISEQIKNLCIATELLMEMLKCNLDIEWGILNDTLYIFQARPMFYSIASCMNPEMMDRISAKIESYKGRTIAKGIAMWRCNRSGLLRVENLSKIDVNDIIDASAIIVSRGGLLAHSASIARELGIPAIICDLLCEGEEYYIVDGYTGIVIPWSNLDKKSRASFLWEAVWHICNYVNKDILKQRGIIAVEIQDEVESVVSNKEFMPLENYSIVKTEKQFSRTFDTSDRELIESNIIFREQVTDQYIRLQVKQYSLSDPHYRFDRSMFLYFASEVNLKQFVEQFPVIVSGTQVRTVSHFEYEGYTINLIDWDGRLKYYTLSTDKPDTLLRVCTQGTIPMSDLLCKGGRDIFKESNIELDFKV